MDLHTRSASESIPLQASLWRGETPRYAFSGHQAFPFRYAWLPKGVGAVREEPEAFLQPPEVRLVRRAHFRAGFVRHPYPGNERLGMGGMHERLFRQPQPSLAGRRDQSEPGGEQQDVPPEETQDVDPPVRPPSSSSSVLIATKAFFPEAGYQRSLQLDDRLRCVYVSAPAVRASGRGDSATVFRLGGHCRTCNAFMLRRIGHVGNKWNCRDWTLTM